MTDGPDITTRKAKRRDVFVAAWLVGVFGLMLGASYAAVPLYKLICQATGIYGTTQRAAANTSVQILERTVTVHFDANTGGGIGWEFKPVAEHMTVRLGETAMAYFTAYNPAGHTVTGTATFNVTPEVTGRYFVKIQCFCFTQQTLKTGERVEMPVTFFVDPALATDKDAKSIQRIVLSYTFTPVTETKPATASAVAATPKGT